MFITYLAALGLNSGMLTDLLPSSLQLVESLASSMCGTFRCGMRTWLWHLGSSSSTMDRTWIPKMEAWSLRHQVTREVPEASLLVEKDGLKSSHQVLDSNKRAGEGEDLCFVQRQLTGESGECQREKFEMKTFFLTALLRFNLFTIQS